LEIYNRLCLGNGNDYNLGNFSGGVIKLNHIALIGRFTRNPELRYTPNGIPVANFYLAVDRPGMNQAGEWETDFIRIIAWQKQGENAAKYLSKGRLAAVEGRLQIRSYEDQQGQKRRVAEVVAGNIQYLDRAREGSQAGETDFSYDDMNLDDLPF
jgi:single-strand DNA-binding protein